MGSFQSHVAQGDRHLPHCFGHGLLFVTDRGSRGFVHSFGYEGPRRLCASTGCDTLEFQCGRALLRCNSERGRPALAHCVPCRPLLHVFRFDSYFLTIYSTLNTTHHLGRSTIPMQISPRRRVKVSYCARRAQWVLSRLLFLFCRVRVRRFVLFATWMLLCLLFFFG